MNDMTNDERREIIDAYQSKLKEAVDTLQDAYALLQMPRIVCDDELLTRNEQERLAELTVALARMAYAEWLNA